MKKHNSNPGRPEASLREKPLNRQKGSGFLRSLQSSTIRPEAPYVNKMSGFPQKICLIFTIFLSTDVEFIKGKPVNNAKLNPLLEVGCIVKKL